MQTPLLFQTHRSLRAGRAPEKRGAVYTKAWITELILDMAGYEAEGDLAAKFAVEPAAGGGTFLAPIAARLIRPARLKGREPLECRDSPRRHFARKDGRSCARTIDRVNSALTARQKLYVADIKDRLNRGETYPHHNLYFVQSDGWGLEVLSGRPLSDVAQFFDECCGIRM